jgi:NAD(P)-dependent dehydrogenase (short-subunit alcohol dehydrogenase family)
MRFEYSSVYAASKFGLEGWMGGLEQEVGPFGIRTTIVNPGWFRTELIRRDPALCPQVSVDDYAERSAAQREWWEAQDGKQSGDPAKLAPARACPRR